jgi:hypothetical protein
VRGVGAVSDTQVLAGLVAKRGELAGQVDWKPFAMCLSRCRRAR